MTIPVRDPAHELRPAAMELSHGRGRGSVTVSGTSLVYRANPSATGEDYFLAQVTDPSGRTATAGVIVTILPGGGIPIPTGPELPTARRTIPVTTATWAGIVAGNSSWGAIRPGDRLVLADGTYTIADWRIPGTPSDPIVITAQNILGVRSTNSPVLHAADVVLRGIDLDGRHIVLNNDRTRVLRCRVRNYDGRAIEVNFGDDCEVAFCEIVPVGIGISAQPAPDKGRDVRRPRVRWNYIHDQRQGTISGNDNECIELGLSRGVTDYKLEALVEWNLMLRCNVGKEAENVSIKSSDNVVRLNTIDGNSRFLTNRHGERNEISSNWVGGGSQGMNIFDRGAMVISNTVEGEINIRAGNVTASVWPGQGPPNHTHPAAENVLVSDNRAERLNVGEQFGGHNIPALNTLCAGNRTLAGGALAPTLKQQSGTRTQATATRTRPAARRLQPNEVGPLAPWQS